MINLDFPTAPVWLTLPHGVRVQVRPFNTAIMKAAHAYAVRILVDLAKAQRERTEAGMPVLPGEYDINDPDVRAGLSEMLTNKGLARFAIIAWEGVGGVPGPDAFARLMEVPVFSQPFIDQYLATQRVLDDEGNASAPAADGTSAAGATTAAAAASAETPAPPASLH